MTFKTILFTAVAAADEAYKTLIAMIDVTLDCNAITYNNLNEETIKWLIKDDYCRVGARERIYPYLFRAIAEDKNTTTYQYNELQIEQKYLPPADWEFTTKDIEGKIVDKTWWGYEDGKMNIGIYIDSYLIKQ
jgi:hypothetical protein